MVVIGQVLLLELVLVLLVVILLLPLLLVLQLLRLGPLVFLAYLMVGVRMPVLLVELNSIVALSDASDCSSPIHKCGGELTIVGGLAAAGIRGTTLANW